MSNVTLKWLGGAGFIIENGELCIGIDLYLSNACMNEDGAFKRLMPPPILPGDLDMDYLIATHEHGDHLDPGSICDFISMDTKTRLICPTVTKRDAISFGVDSERITLLNRGEALDFDGFSIRAVPSDHGDASPDAIGVFINIGGKTIYFMGDTCFRTDFIEYIGWKEEIDVMLVAINGKFGNPDSRDAAHFMQMLKPKLTIPCHFWLFAEHGGNPGDFIEYSKSIAPGLDSMLLCIDEKIEL